MIFKEERIASKEKLSASPLLDGYVSNAAYLVLQYIDFDNHHDWKVFGKALAQMHRISSTKFGFGADNFIGSSIQKNTQKDNWLDFWRQCRLGFQLELAYENGWEAELRKPGSELLERLPEFFESYRPQPSLLHGDLWSGNCASRHGVPYIFDPACYYGDRETDVAMTELFGGFSGEFYEAYNEVWPLDSAYEKRRVLYNLYHILNHLNIFGDIYLSQAQSMLRRLLN